MAWYRNGDRVWLVEQRGRVVWFRTGIAGNKGVISRHERDSDDAAADAMRGYVAMQIADGFELVDEATSIDGNVLPGTKPVEKPIKVFPSQLRTQLEKRLELPLTVRAAATALLEILKLPATHRVACVELGLVDDASTVTFGVRFTRGDASGNPDGDDVETMDVILHLEPLDRDDLDDGFKIDIFEGESFHTAGIVALFAKELEQCAPWAVIADLPVVKLELW